MPIYTLLFLMDQCRSKITKITKETFKYPAMANQEMEGKRGYIISYADWFKGFLIGLIIGGVLVYLFANGFLKVPSFGAQKETAKLIIPLVPFYFRK